MTQPVNPSDVYLIFSATLDTQSVQRISNALSLAMGQQAKHVHLALHTPGGGVADGIFLYNLFRSATIEVTLYNMGTVASAGVLAYLGAKNRNASTYATFMTHGVSSPAVAATSAQLQGIAHSVELDDARCGAILRAHLKLSEDAWKATANRVDWSAQEAVEIGLCHAVAEFAPPFGQQVFNI